MSPECMQIHRLSCRRRQVWQLARQVRTQHAVLPREHPQSVAALLERATAAVEGSQPAEAAQHALRQMMEDEEHAFYQVKTLMYSRLCT